MIRAWNRSVRDVAFRHALKRGPWLKIAATLPPREEGLSETTADQKKGFVYAERSV